MICQVCKEPGILNHANMEPFWYCRSCKIEILPEVIFHRFSSLETDLINMLEMESNKELEEGVSLDENK